MQESKLFPKAVPSLAELQNWFRTQIIGQRSEDSPRTNLCRKVIQATPPLSEQIRLKIYSTAWWLRLRESLYCDYPHLARSLGETSFDKLLRAYLQRHPSRSYTLAHAGDRLPDFLAKWRNKDKKPWHQDLARLERACYQAYAAADAEAWDLAQEPHPLGHDPEHIPLCATASVALLKSRWAVHSLRNGETASPSQETTYCLIYRKGFTVTVDSVTARQFRALRLLARRCTLGEYLDSFAHRQAVGWLSAWAASGVIQPAFKDAEDARS